MSTAVKRPYLAEFPDADTVLEATDRLLAKGVRIADALTPYPMPALAERLGAQSGALRPVMALAGFGVALFFFGLQIWSQAYAYPLNSGGRPLASWQVYGLVPFETGVLAAAIAGYLVLFWRTGLPRYHHPVFAIPSAARATQDRYVLIIDGPVTEFEARRLERTLFALGAVSVREAGP